MSYIRKFIYILPILVTLGIGLYVNHFIRESSFVTPVMEEDNLLQNISFLLDDAYKTERDTIHLINITRHIDNLYGVAAGLYEKDGGILYVIDSIPDVDCPGIPPEFFQVDKYEYHSNYFISDYTFQSDAIFKNGTHKFFYATINDMVLIWGVRPDLINRYFFSYENALRIIIFSLFIIIVSNLVAQIISRKNLKQ
jgi:hypothetical protein